MTDHELVEALERRADAREGDAIVPLLRAAAKALRRLLGKSRSTPQHRRYFALIKAAFNHWPHSHDIQFGSAEGLRDYLQLKAGFGTVHKIIRGNHVWYWVEHKSIAYNKMSQDEFQQLSTKVEKVIEEVVGVPADQLLNEDRNAA